MGEGERRHKKEETMSDGLPVSCSNTGFKQAKKSFGKSFFFAIDRTVDREGERRRRRAYEHFPHTDNGGVSSLAKGDRGRGGKKPLFMARRELCYASQPEGKKK